MALRNDSAPLSKRISPETLLGRIEEIQAELLAVLVSDKLEDLEPLTNELSSRLRSLDGLDDEVLSDPAHTREERLRRIGQVQRELATFAAERLQAIAGELKHASSSRALGHKYTIDPARARARLLSCMDLEG